MLSSRRSASSTSSLPAGKSGPPSGCLGRTDRWSHYEFRTFAHKSENKAHTWQSKVADVPEVGGEGPVQLAEVLLGEARLPDGAEHDGLGLGVESPHRLADPHEADPVLGAEALLLVGVQDVLQQGDHLTAGQVRQAAARRDLDFQPSLDIATRKVRLRFK